MVLLLPALDTQDKINLLAKAAHFDVAGPWEGREEGEGAWECEDEGGSEILSTQNPALSTGSGRVSERLARHITRMAAGRGPLLKVVMSDSCHNSCLYCPFGAGVDRPRTAFQPEELATAFAEMYARGRASGLFLSSGLAGNPRRAMEEMLKTAEMLRRRLHYPGYLHLKILPGATDEYIEAACGLADRVSSNLEAPNERRLAVLCPEKRFEGDLLSPMRKVDAIRRKGAALSYGQITQFVVGAAGESDRELLETTGRLYREVNLTRAYFSAFRPLRGTPLEGQPPASQARQRRLYQADSLLRQYGFGPEELPLGQDGNLAEDRDPKLEWARLHPERFPLEVNRAARQDLLRVPGIGPRGASSILNARRKAKLRSWDDLKNLGLQLSRAAPYLLADGRLLSREKIEQLSLWDL